jgi:hypothetical protein
VCSLRQCCHVTKSVVPHTDRRTSPFASMEGYPPGFIPSGERGQQPHPFFHDFPCQGLPLPPPPGFPYTASLLGNGSFQGHLRQAPFSTGQTLSGRASMTPEPQVREPAFDIGPTFVAVYVREIFFETHRETCMFLSSSDNLIHCVQKAMALHPISQKVGRRTEQGLGRAPNRTSTVA